MVTYRTSVPSGRAPADVFDYLARFSNALLWDPGVAAAEDITPGPPALGSTYRLMVRFLGLTVPLEYQIEAIDRPRRVVLQAENAMVRSTDIIEVASTSSGGSTVTYEATLIPKGVAAALTPLLALLFGRIGSRAAGGLRAALAA
jgi:polyketide cyclase/dehydrase/lipid transport protein